MRVRTRSLIPFALCLLPIMIAGCDRATLPNEGQPSDPTPSLPPAGMMGGGGAASITVPDPDPGPTRLELEIEGKGVIVIDVYPGRARETAERIVELAKQGFFDGQRIHRVEHWVIQFGAPASKDMPLDHPDVLGGGSGKQLQFEQTRLEMTRGAVAMASKGPQSGGDSQIFILKETNKSLEGSYTGFGRVVTNMELVDQLEIGDRIKSFKVVFEPAGN